MVPKCRVSSLALIFVIGHEESLGADHTGVHSNIFGPPVITCKRPLMTYSLSNIVCERAELISQVLFSMLQ